MNIHTEFRKIVEDHVCKLGETFDAGVVIVTYQNAGETFFEKIQFGNKFAVEKLISDANDGTLNAREDEDEDEDDGENWKKATA